MTTLQQYLQLQWLMLKRQLTEFGINPFVGIAIFIIGFYGFSYYLFNKTGYAKYFYILIALSVVIKYSETNRNDFLKFTFSKKNYFKIRTVENMLTVLPFIIFLSFKIELYAALLLILLSVAIIFLNIRSASAVTIPTPFYKKPFEFIVGFRKSFAGFLFAYFLTIMSFIYLNLNLGIGSLMLVFLICLSFYSEPENEFYVWVHKLNVNNFLWDKIKTALVFSTVLSLPVAIVLFIFFPANGLTILGFQALGYSYIVTIVLAKYAAYPQKINLPQGILLALSIAIPILLIVVIPFFYTQSNKRLKDILA